MSDFNLMKWKTDQWEHLKDDRDKCIIVGRLEMMKDFTEYFNNVRESYTRLLVVNGVTEEDYDKLKKRYHDIKGLDGDVNDNDNGSSESDDGNHYVKVLDDDGDETSFNNC